MEKPVIRLVFVGHIDHGKSTLIGRLLFDTNSLKPEKVNEVLAQSKALGKDIEYSFVLDSFLEEREQGITIDIIRIPFLSENYEYQIIDCPGHKEFIKNMISGASQAEAAVLLVSAKEGVEEQTKRHSFLLNFLGIKKVIVAVNKMDLVDYSQTRFNEVKRVVGEYLTSVGFEQQHMTFVPLSAKVGDNVIEPSANLAWYPKTFMQILDKKAAQKEAKEQHFRMPIQDVIDIDGENYALGTVVSGSLRVGEKVGIAPHGLFATVVDVRDFTGSLMSAREGQSVGLKLNGALVTSELIGAVSYTQSLTAVSNTINSQVIVFTDNELREGEDIDIRLGTRLVQARVLRIVQKVNTAGEDAVLDNNLLAENEAGMVLLTTRENLAFEKFSDVESLGRLVLLRNGRPIGAGVVL
ncbi:hypothetical protein COT72_04040 [archaeon CG10_big_fil_rev_8_21_14_0_10_43_11]|nr:MAG: hypothetical protein COT72_04040 [archaeon CG10_big_fil_rev_8_21_14_0_10_43_11]